VWTVISRWVSSSDAWQEVLNFFKFFYKKEVFNFHNVGGGPVMTYVRHMNTLWTPSVLVVELWWAKEDVSFKD